MKMPLHITSYKDYKTVFSTNTAYLHLGIILLLGIISYSNALNLPMQFDDKISVHAANGTHHDLYSFEGFVRKARWFTDVTFSLNQYLHGDQVLGYHVINLAIHLLSAVVVYLFVAQAITALKQTYRISYTDEYQGFLQGFIPFTTAALFVCHPLQTQAVTYIAQRYTSLATLLYLSSLLSYLQARLSCLDETKKLHVWTWGLASLFFAVLAMKSKEIAFTLPIMSVALESALFRGRLLRNRFYILIGMGLLLVIPLQLFYTHGMASTRSLLHHIQLATAETPLISRSDYLLTQFRVIATYLRLLILPINQNLDYDYPVYHSLFDPSVFASLLLHIALAGLALVLFIRSKRQFASGNQSAAITMRLASLGIVWFYLALSVESSLIPINDVIFEHRLYLPSVGFFIATAACLAGFTRHHQRYRTTLWTATLLICLVLTASTIIRHRTWSDEMVMWQDVLKKSPDKARVRHSVGVLYFRKFMPKAALPHLVRTVELEPSTEKYWTSLNAQVAILPENNGRCTDGMEYHATIDKVDPAYKKPWAAISYNNLGLAYEYLGNMYLARENYQKAVAVNPALDFAWYNLALVAARLHDTANVTSALLKLNTINHDLGQDASKTIREQHPSVQLIP